VRESTRSWKELLLDLKRRGLSMGPELAVADVEEIWPQTRGQRSWVHKTANVLVIESSFATVRHRTVRSKGCLSNKTAFAYEVIKKRHARALTAGSMLRRATLWNRDRSSAAWHLRRGCMAIGKILHLAGIRIEEYRARELNF
jgi:hypothetical protein